MSSQQAGMGCTLKTIGGRIVVTEVKAGGGAAASGNVQPYDVLVSVDGVRLQSTDHAKLLLLGAAGTCFIAGLERNGKPLSVSIWRGGIQQKAGAHRPQGASAAQAASAPVCPPDAQRPGPSVAQRTPAAARPPPSPEQIRAFSASSLFDECCCPPRNALTAVQKLQLFNLLALRAQDLALHAGAERGAALAAAQELRAISASCGKIQVVLDGIDVTGADRDFRKSIIKLCEAVASQCDDALA
jgi:hypothetical protein